VLNNERSRATSASLSEAGGCDSIPIAVFWQETSDVNGLIAHVLKPLPDTCFASAHIQSFPAPNDVFAQAGLLATAPKAPKEPPHSKSRTASPTKMPSFSRGSSGADKAGAGAGKSPTLPRRTGDKKSTDKQHSVHFLKDISARIRDAIPSVAKDLLA
jgi:hypothetical protein